jgi:hypothetical protein
MTDPKTQTEIMAATEYIINDKGHPEVFNGYTINSDLIDKLKELKLVEPLDLRVTSKTLDTVIDYSDAIYWDTSASQRNFLSYTSASLNLLLSLVSPTCQYLLSSL